MDIDLFKKSLPTGVNLLEGLREVRLEIERLRGIDQANAPGTLGKDHNLRALEKKLVEILNSLTPVRHDLDRFSQILEQEAVSRL